MTAYSVCAIGNSHAGAIRQAWANRVPAVRAEFSIAFFSAAGHQLRHLALRKRMLIARDRELKERFLDSAGEKRIEIDRYDAFVLIGMEFGIDMLKLCGTSGVVEHLRLGPVERVMSHACFAAMVRESFETSFSLQLAKVIRSVSRAPILLCAAPFRPEHVLDDPEYRDQKRLRDPALLEAVVGRAKDAAIRIASKANCEVLWQDDSTIGLPGFTKYALSRHSTAAGKKVIELDRRHGNEDYGAIILDSIMHRLDELSGGSVIVTAPKPELLRSA